MSADSIIGSALRLQRGLCRFKSYSAHRDKDDKTNPSQSLGVIGKTNASLSMDVFHARVAQR